MRLLPEAVTRVRENNNYFDFAGQNMINIHDVFPLKRTADGVRSKANRVRHAAARALALCEIHILH